MIDTPAQSRYQLPPPAYLLIWVIFTFSWGIWAYPLFDLDEGAFSAATWEMLQRQNFITTYLNGELRFDKPILIYWLQAISVSVFGINEFAFRLPSSLAALLWAWASYRFVNQHLSHTQAQLAIWLMSSALMIVLISHAATADALLNLLLSLTLYQIYTYLKQPSKTPLYMAYALMGLGVLTKGPIAVFIPLCVSLIYCTWDKRLKTLFSALLHWPAWLLFLAIAAPWYTLAYLDQGQSFIDGFIVTHNLERFSDTMLNHGGFWWYYIAAIFIVIMPFGAWWLELLCKIRIMLTDSLGKFLLSWFIFVFIFFSLSKSQLPHYLLYGTMPVILLMARHAKQVKWQWLSFIPSVAFSLLLVALPLWLQQQAGIQVDNVLLQALAKSADGAFTLTYTILSLLLLITTVLLLALYKRPIYQRLLALGLAQTVVFLFALVPAAAHLQQTPVKNAAQFLQDNQITAKVWMDRINMPSITVYRQAITPTGQALNVGDWVFTRIDRLRDPADYKIRFQQSAIILAEKIR